MILSGTQQADGNRATLDDLFRRASVRHADAPAGITAIGFYRRRQRERLRRDRLRITSALCPFADCRGVSPAW